MLKSKVEKKQTRAEAEKKVEAWKTINSVLVQSNAKFMTALRNLVAENEAILEGLKTKLEANEGTEQDNAEVLFVGGYVQALKDILGIKENGQ